MPNPKTRFFALILSLCAASVAMAGGPFLDLTVEEALARAKAEEKLVFLDFFATWCGPCKQLDSTTFADEKVVEWLGRHTVPVKIDVDRRKETAKRYHVSAMPTLVFLRADGTELQRIKGYRPSSQFLAAAGEVAEHPEKDVVARAREELESGQWPEAMARQKLAAALAAGGKKEEALGEYRKAMDSLGTDKMSRQYQLRLVHEVAAMAHDDPPAAEMLQTLREDLVKRVETGKADRYDVDQITAIDIELKQEEKTLDLYNRLAETGDVPPELMARFARGNRDLLLRDRKFAALEKEMPGGLLFAALSAVNSLKRQQAWNSGDFSDLPAERAETMKRRFGGMSEEERASVAAGLESAALKRIGECYQIARGLDKPSDAGTIAEKLLEVSPGAAAYHTLAANALSSGKPTEADLGYAAKAVELDNGGHPEYGETLAGLREQLGAAGAPAESGETEGAEPDQR